MSKDEWSRLESTDRGRDLIAYAGKLVDQQTAVTSAIDRIRMSPDATNRQSELIEAVQKLDAINKELGGLQQKAKQIIEVTVLDETPKQK